MTQLKNIHLGKCIDDLEKHYTLPDIKNHKIKVLLNTAQKLYENAEKNRLEGDEELSYIFFMKYFNLIGEIRKLPDYSQQKLYITKMLGTNSRVTSAMDKTEKLCKSLKKRYEALTLKNETLKNNQINSSIDSNRMETDDESFIKDLTSVTSQELYKMTQDPKTSLLIIDCRSKTDYHKSCLKFPSLNVPEEIILVGMSAGKLQQKLEQESKALWSSRSIKDHIILMDWSSRGPEPMLHTPIWRLRDIMTNWDPDVTYRSPIKILQGGFENFILIYPTQCTDPNVQAPIITNSEVEVLDDIEYPSINDITMKDDVGYSTPKKQIGTENSLVVSRPNINRSAKLAAIKTYDEKQRVIEILKERETLMEKTLENEKRRLEAENAWQDVSLLANNEEAEEQRRLLTSREQELLYNIMQLESNERDYKLENERLIEQLEEYKRREKEYGEIVSAKEAENLEQVTKRIEVKLKECQQIDEKREKYTQEREKQLAIAREQKRHLKPPTVEDEISKPKIPQFDRSIKPIVKPEPEFIETNIQRDFAPIPGSPGRGLTGLKNLGNTCYMNSIMQCLSNTTLLADYFISNTFKKHINRSNKTQGRIVEEVAALLKILWSGHFKCVASKDLRYVVGQYQQIFRGVEQQDSHEFLTILMDWLHSDLQTLVINESPRDNLPPSKKAWLEFTKSRESQILRLFYGQIKSTVKCVECNKESATYECFSNLSLELPSTNSRCNIQDCLDMYFNGEKIHGWNCPNCKQKRDAIKKLDTSILPPILVIHFKRFYADPDTIGNTYKKKQNYVRFPLDKFSMSSYIARSERTAEPKVYHLYAVSNHYGSMESGHYTAFCRSSVLGKWYKFDDQIVSSLDSSDVVSSAAYILFYSRYNETPPSEVM